MRARLAYHESLTAVIFMEKLLHQQHISWQQFFNWLISDGFNKALQRATSHDTIDFEIAWYRWLKETYQWFLIFNWENLIWLIIIIILLGSIYAVRYRNRKTLEAWEKQEIGIDEYQEDSHLIDRNTEN
jgi:hypothetical protein